MKNEIQYTTIQALLARLTLHPLLADTSIEQVVMYTIDFMRTVGMPQFYMNKEIEVEVEDYKALLPTDVISIEDVRDKRKNLSLHKSSNDFDLTSGDGYKVKGSFIFVGVPKTELKILYKSIPVDELGFPLLLDDPLYLRALELYIKKERFIELFDCGEIRGDVLQHAEQQSAWAIGQVTTKLKMPSAAELEAIMNMCNRTITRTHEFSNSFANLGDKVRFKHH